MKQNLLYKLLFLVSLLTFGIQEMEAQLYFKIQLMQDDTAKWGVYVRYFDGVSGAPSSNLIPGSGQVTIVAPTGWTFGAIQNFGASWSQNARVNSPPENPDYDYVSFGYQSNTPAVVLTDTTETLLFTITRTGACPDTLYLIDNNTDPFNVIPNSAGNNPGNEFSIYDATRGLVYNWSGNYAFSAWSCHDCDDDGYLNGIEDNNWDGDYDITDGNGVYDLADTTDMCNPCDPIHPLLAEMYGDTVMCSAEDNVPIYISTVDWHPVYNWEPYTVTYQNAAGTQTVVNNYYPGDPIIVSPTATDTFTIVSMIDQRGCSPDTIRGRAIVTVEGPISVSVDPVDVDECYGNGTSFSVTTANSGTGTILYNWQISSNNVTFTDLDNGTPYTGVYTNTLNISNVAGLNDLYYRVKIYTTTCDTVYSGSAQLNVEGPVSITTQPTTHSECSGNGTTFTAAASAPLGTLSTLWQVSTDGGATYTDLSNTGVYSGTSTGTLSISDVANLYNNYYRMKAWTPTCDTVFSNGAQLRVEGPLTIDNQPVSESNCAGKSINFTVGVSMPDSASGTIRYQWEISYDNQASWQALANDSTFNGVRTDTLSVDISDSLDGTCYRVNIWTTECTLITSNVACLSVSAEAEFTFQPEDVTICNGLDTFFLANATVQQGTFTYQWMVSKDNGASWSDVANGADVEGVVYAGATTDSLRLTGIVTAMTGFRYRVEARTADCNPASSSEALLRVEGPVSITTPLSDDVVCRGDQAAFEIIAANGAGNAGAGGYNALLYQWQVKPVGTGVWVNLNANNAVYGGIGTRRLTISTTQGGNHGDSIRVITSTPTCATLTSNAVRLNIEGPVVFTDMPNDTVVCSGSSTSFSATFRNSNGGDVDYVWQRSDDGGANYSDMTDVAPFSNTNGTLPLDSASSTQTLVISDVTGLDSTWFRLKIRTGQCEWEYSEGALLIVEGPLDIDLANQPQNVTLCATGNAKFFVNADNGNSGALLYQWQIKRASGGGWTDLRNDTTYNGVRSDTLNIAPATAAMNGDSVRVLVSTGTCAAITSNGALLSVEGPVTITNEADDQTICSGDPVSFSIAYTNPGAGTPALQWQVSTDGLTWNNVPASAPYSGVNTLTLSLSAADSSYDGYKYRVAYSLSTCGTSYSDEATLTVEGPIHFTDQPDDVTSCSTEDITFQVSTFNGGAGTILYQWQRSTDGGASFQNLTNGIDNFNGVNSPILSLGEIATGMDGDIFRVIIRTGTCARDTSIEATLTVEGPLTFTDQPDDLVVCSGNDTTFVVAVTNPGAGSINYRWEYSLSEFSGYIDVPDNAVFDDVSTNTLVINDVAGLGGYYFRARTWTSTCAATFSEAGHLTVEGPLSSTDPLSITVCNANSALFNIDVTNTGSGLVNYQWQINRGSGWSDIPANDTLFGTIFNGVRSDTLSVSDIIADSLNGAQFRARYWSAVCNSTYTLAATLTIEGPLSITDQPIDTTVCSGEPAFFATTVDVGQGGTASYQWQVSTNGVSWTNLTNTGVYTGANTNRLDISNVANLGGRRYRARVWTGDCDPIFTDLARLTVNGPVVITNQPDSMVACQNEAYFFDATVVNNGSGTMSFQWEVYDVGGMTWSDINDETGIRGTNTTVLQLDSMPLMRSRGDTVFRLRIDLATCNSTYSQTVLLQIVSDTLGFCDFDLDGLINDDDPDDDNDGLDDIWEYSCMTYGQFNPDVDNDGDLDGEEDWDGDQIINSEETDNDGILDGDPCDPCDPLVSIACFGISIDVKAMLFGAAYKGVQGADSLMKDSLRRQNLIPLTEPYSNFYYLKQGVTGDTIRPFVHKGPGGGETTSQPVLDVTGQNAIVDWVFIELRSANKIDSIIATRSALLQADGDVVDVDGVSAVSFGSTVLAGPHYVAIRHRNHLGVMTIDAPELSPQTRVVDFKDTLSVRHGASPQRKTGKYFYLWGGDMRADRQVVYQGPDNDIQELFLEIITDPYNTSGPNGTPNANHIKYGYLPEDFDMDGKAIYQGPGNDRIMVLLQTTIPHRGNANIIANFIVVEQLP